MKYRPKHIAEYLFLRIIAFPATVLPYPMTLGIAWVIAVIGFYVFRFRKAETLRRMRIVFGDKYTSREYNRMAWIAARNTAFNAIELLINKKSTLEWCNKIFDYEETINVLKKQAATGKGGIIAGPHMGTWDLAGIAFAHNGIPTIGIVGHQRNPLVNKYFDDIRNSAGIECLVRGENGILKKIIRLLKQGQFLGINPDARMKTPAIEMPFLGGTANLGSGAANFARMTQLPIFPIIITRIGWSRHKIRSLPTIEPDMTLDKKTDIMRMTSLLVEQIDREIQDDPEQWFWYNSRWVLDPVK
ncbi:MAG: hypothetical protein B1H11_12640 [Desulfobacteraceae bacterium 4484_190.1]|nr:MAG: hypothetical protein B1H11_12640 [Desulfobacteraceae bacterium 4484_190.1]